MTSITVAIPLYYKTEWDELRNCLISINNQIIKPNEIVITVNGFEEGLIDKNKFQDFVNGIVENIEVKVFYLKKASISKALNECIAKSNCEWICRIDADDRMMPNRIKSFVKCLDEKKFNDLWLFYSEVFTLENGKLGGIWKTCKPSYLKMQLSIKNPIHHVSVFFKKNIIQEIGCYRNIPKVEDYDLWLRLYRYSKFRNNRDAFFRFNKPLVAYNIDLRDIKESLSYKSIDTKTIYQMKNLDLMPYPILTLLSLFPVNLFSKIRQFLRPITYRLFQKLRFKFKII